MMKISFLLQATNRVTGPVNAALRSIRRIAGATASAAGGFEKMGASVDGATRRMTRSMGRTASAAVSMTRRMGMAFAGLYDFTRDAGHHFRTVIGEDGIARAGRSVSYLRSQVSGLTGGLTLLKYASIAAGIGLGEEFVRGVFKAGGDMQQMMVTLTRLEGSKARAAQAMNWMQSFGMGAGAAFSMPDIMKSYQMAVNFGMNPQGGSLAAFADLAAGERVSMRQVLFAVKDAMEGTSTRPLANLGIKMKQGRKAGDPNSYLYSDGAGKFHTITSAKTPEAVLSTLVGIINSKYSGLATAQAKTVPGGIQQMQKLLYLFEGKVAGAGVFDWALKQMNRFFAYIRKMSASGDLDRLAKRISDFMVGTGNKLIGFVQSTDWRAVGKDLLAIGGALGAIAKALGLVSTLGGGGISGLLNLFVASKVFGFTQAILGLIAPLASLSLALIGVDIAALPLDAIIIAIAALAAAAYLVWANWSTIGPKLTKFFKKLWADITPPQWLSLLAGGPAGIASLIGQKIGVKLGAAMAPSGAPKAPKPGGPGGKPPEGRLVIELAGAGASQAQIKALKATGMTVDVKRGIANGNPG